MTETDPKPRDFNSLTSFLTYRLSRLQNQLNAQAIHVLHAHSDVSLTEWRILLTIHQTGPKTLSELVDLIGMDKGQLSRGIKLLLSKDYLLSVKVEGDLRSQSLSIPPLGQKVVDEVYPVMQRRQAQLSTSLSDEELALFFAIIDRLEAAAQERGF